MMSLQSRFDVSDMLRSGLQTARALLYPRFEDADPLAETPALDAVEKAPAPPLPPCRPFNDAEAGEAATLAQLRGALYPTEARS